MDFVGIGVLCFVLIDLIDDYKNDKKSSSSSSSSYKPINKYYFYENKYFLCTLLE